MTRCSVFEEQVVQYEAYKEVSSSYLICTLDAAIPVAAQVSDSQVASYRKARGMRLEVMQMDSLTLVFPFVWLLPCHQEAMATQAGIPHIERLEASHSPFLSKPKELAAFLKRAADRAQAA